MTEGVTVVDYPFGFGTPLKNEAIIEEAKDPHPDEMLGRDGIIGSSLRPIPQISVHETAKNMLAKRNFPDLRDIIDEDLDGALNHLIWDEEVRKRWANWFPIRMNPTTLAPPDAILPLSSHKLGTWSAKGKIPDADKKKMQERLKNLVGAAPWGSAKRTGDPVKATPIVIYYITRYLAAQLIHSGMAENAMPKRADNDIETQRIITNIEREPIEDIMTRLFHHESSGHSTIDHLFDFSPLGTQIRYPESWEGGDPQPTATDQNTIPGLLQKLYARLTSGARQEFKNDVKNLITSLPHSATHISSNGKWTLAALEPEVAEAATVWIEEMEIGGGGRQNLRGTYDLQNPSEKLTPGAVLSIPGILLLREQVDNGVNLLNRIFGSLVEPFSDEPEYRDYVRAYIDREAENKAQIEDIAKDDAAGHATEEELAEQRELAEENNRITEAKKALASFLRANLTATVVSINPDEVSLIIEGLPAETPIDEGLTVYSRPSLFKGLHATTSEKAVIKADKTSRRTGLVTSRFLFDEVPWVMRDMLGPDDITSQDEEGGEDGLGYFETMPYAETLSSDDPNRQVEILRPVLIESAPDYTHIDYSDSRGFAALGQIIGWCIIRTSSNMAETMTQTSYIDNIVNGLTGRENNPGLAAYHAVIHYKFLFEQLREAIAGGEAGLIQEGRSLSLEIYAEDPAKLMLYWLLTENGYIDIAGLDETGIPNFFTVPLDEMGVARTETSLMNGLALLVIGYYRLSFSQLRLRRLGTNMKAGEVNLPELWTKLTQEAKADPPEPHAFATVLRFMSGPGKALRIPAWLTALPKDIAGKKKDRDPEEVRNYLKWAYGDNPQSIEVFAEVCAAYHAAKTLSYYEPGDYQEMTEAFIDGVSRDKGHPFLVALLLLDVTDAAVYPQIPLRPVPTEPIRVEQAGDPWELVP